jgi:hypothetical protein
LATVELKLGNREVAHSLYDECLAIREPFARANPNNLDAAIEWMLALARCGRIGEARTKAENLLKVAEAPTPGSQSTGSLQLQSGFALAISADNVDRSQLIEQWTPEQMQERNTLLDRSINALEKTIASGFNDAFQLETDPDIDALRGDPRFKALLEKLRTTPR